MIIGLTSAVLVAFGAVLGLSIFSRLRLSRSFRHLLGVEARPRAALSYRATAIPILQPKLRQSLLPVRLDVEYVPWTKLWPVGLLVAHTLMGDDLDSFGFAQLLALTAFTGAGLGATFLLGRSGTSANLAVAAFAHGLAIHRPFKGAFLAWKDVQTIFVDPPDRGGFFESETPASLYIMAEDGREWRFGENELAVGAEEMAKFADFAHAQAYNPAAMRRR